MLYCSGEYILLTRMASPPTPETGPRISRTISRKSTASPSMIASSRELGR